MTMDYSLLFFQHFLHFLGFQDFLSETMDYSLMSFQDFWHFWKKL